MRVVVTRPQRDSERTAALLRARGHDVLVASLMRVEPLAADLAGKWGAIIVTSANAPDAIASNPVREALTRLPLFAVGQRSADAARQAGFVNVSPADGDVRDLMRMLIARPDGSAACDVAGRGSRKDAATIGTEAGRELKHRAGPGFLD